MIYSNEEPLVSTYLSRGLEGPRDQLLLHTVPSFIQAEHFTIIKSNWTSL